MANDSTLLGLLFGKPKEAGKNISTKKKYDRYVTETQSKGQKPMSFDEYKKKHGSD